MAVTNKEQLSKGVESFTYCVGLLTASLALFLFLSKAESVGEITTGIIWLTLSTPIHFMAHKAFMLAGAYTFDLTIRENPTEGAIAFMISVPMFLLLLSGLGYF